jgi:4-hydroxy-tetrahydrodipicolinate reductase
MTTATVDANGLTRCIFTAMHDVENTKAIRIGLVGYGAMGRQIEAIAESHNAIVTGRYTSHNPVPGNGDLPFDVAIDFTRPDAIVSNVNLLAGRVPIVVGTTGWTESLDEVTSIITSRNGRLIHGSNFSIGVALFMRIVREASTMFNTMTAYDVAVREVHHARKADAPSGTALSIADVILAEVDRKVKVVSTLADRRIEPDELSVSSSRVGSDVGTHSVLFDSDADSIELVHRARNRSGFAIGALHAARWIVEQKPGVYSFDQSL